MKNSVKPRSPAFSDNEKKTAGVFGRGGGNITAFPAGKALCPVSFLRERAVAFGAGSSKVNADSFVFPATEALPPSPERRPESRGRELALQYLYMRETQREGAPSFDEFLAELDDRPAGAAIKFARRLSATVIEHREELDAEISGAGANWRPERMARIERNILRMGLVELQSAAETPFRVVLNEAVELAKRYAGEEAGAFVNGVLDAVRKKSIP